MLELHSLKNQLRKILTYIRSAHFPPPLRKVALVDGLISMDEAFFLYRLASELTEGCIVEVGSYRGRSTTALALGSMQSHNLPVYAVEPHEPYLGYYGGTFGAEDRAAFFRTMLRTKAYNVVRLLNTTSEIITPAWKQAVGLLFIDGDHSYDGVKLDWDTWASHMRSGATVVFDDSVDPKCGPYRLINELIKTHGFTRLNVVGKLTQLALPEPVQVENVTASATVK